MTTAVIAFLVSVVAVWLTIRCARWHIHRTADHTEGVQKFHQDAVPRIGGVGILLGLAVGLLVSGGRREVPPMAPWLLLAAAPVFAAGLIEDITKRVGVKERLAAAMVSAALGYWLLNAQLVRVGIPLFDGALAWPPAAFLLTLVAVAGLSNAVNIIDGFNGLAAAVCMLMFTAFGYVAWSLGDVLLVQVCLAMIGALAGFLVWNYPRGLVFLGDGGAYLVGFVLAEVAVLLVVRHPGLSPWFCLLVCAYPIMETVFSIYRRSFVQRVLPGAPDALHLHTLIYRRLVRWAAGPDASRDMTARNAATSPYLWALASVAIVPAVLFWRSEALLIASAVLFLAAYLVVYVRVVRFRAPRWMRKRVGRR